MRKLVAAITLIVMLFSTIALAEEQQEIKFRGVDWGISYSETVDQLTDFGVRWESPETVDGRKIKSLINNKWSDYYDYKSACKVDAVSTKEKKVAGYDISSVKLYFAYIPNEKGEITHSADDTSFFMAQYKINPTDLDGVYGDLKEKLTSLYGKPAKEDSDGFVIHYNYCYWYGANDTMVVIVTDDNYECIYINYVWNNGEKLMDQANAIQHQAEIDKEKEKFGTDNTDGL